MDADQYYIGVDGVRVLGWDNSCDGNSGYSIRYPDGRIEWIAKAVFEALYRPVA